MVWIRHGAAQRFQEDGERTRVWCVVLATYYPEQRRPWISQAIRLQHAFSVWVQASRGTFSFAWSHATISRQTCHWKVPGAYASFRKARGICIAVYEKTCGVTQRGRQHGSGSYSWLRQLQQPCKYYDLDAYKDGARIQDLSWFEHAFTSEAVSSATCTRRCISGHWSCHVWAWRQIVFIVKK